MPDEMDRHIDSIRSESRRQATYQEWKSQYSPFGRDPFLRPALTLLESPHLDLVVEFSNRALAAQLGEPRLILRAPDDQLYAATLLDPATFRIGRRYQDSRKPTWREKRLVRRAHQNLIRDGRPGTLLNVAIGHHDDRDNVSGTWFVAGNDFYEGYNNYRWGTRDLFAKACALALARHT